MTVIVLLCMFLHFVDFKFRGRGRWGLGVEVDGGVVFDTLCFVLLTVLNSTLCGQPILLYAPLIATLFISNNNGSDLVMFHPLSCQIYLRFYNTSDISVQVSKR